MGKVRTPEEIVARKAKKEAKRTIRKEEVLAKEAQAAAVRAAVGKKAKEKNKIDPDVAAAALAAIRKRKNGDWPNADRPLPERLHPNRPSYDEQLRNAWLIMPNGEKQQLMQEDMKNREGKCTKIDGQELVKMYPFAPNTDDHCETSPQAYKDIAPILTFIAGKLGKEPHQLKIYDPYFCAGSVKRHLGEYGFTEVYNKCENFYDRLANGTVPDHDVIVTNPPYSEDTEGGANHIAKLLRFCTQGGKPFFINMPEYVTSAAYYKKRFDKHGTYPLILCPYKRYHFFTPFGLRKITNKKAHRHPDLGFRSSPFVSLWYISLEPRVSNEKLIRRASLGKFEDIEVKLVETPAGKANEEDKESQATKPEPILVRCRLCRNVEELPTARTTFSKQAELPKQEGNHKEQRKRKDEEVAEPSEIEQGSEVESDAASASDSGNKKPRVPELTSDFDPEFETPCDAQESDESKSQTASEIDAPSLAPKKKRKKNEIDAPAPAPAPKKKRKKNEIDAPTPAPKEWKKTEIDAPALAPKKKRIKIRSAK